jgi:hypothetical protein
VMNAGPLRASPRRQHLRVPLSHTQKTISGRQLLAALLYLNPIVPVFAECRTSFPCDRVVQKFSFGSLTEILGSQRLSSAFKRSAEPIQLPISGTICSQFGQGYLFVVAITNHSCTFFGGFGLFFVRDCTIEMVFKPYISICYEFFEQTTIK